MALVGDVILSFREQATDLPQAYPPPYISSITPIQLPQGQLAPTLIYLIPSTISTWGESITNGEQVFQLAAPNNALMINVVTFPNSLAVRIYYDINGGSGNELIMEEFPVQNAIGTSLVTVFLLGAGVNRFPPNRSTGYNPDSDGMALGAYAAYRWLNAGLNWAAAKNNGGIASFGAVRTQSGQPLYVIPGWWKKITNAWYDGYPLYLGRHNDAFRRNPVPGVAGAFLVHEATDRLIAECWPQPARDGCLTQLAAPISAVDTQATLTNPAQWVLGFGKAMIESEIVEYSLLNGNVLEGLTRGLAGTTAVVHPQGSVVQELNLEISGSRMPTTYSVGAALSTLQAPPGWENPLARYMLYCFRSAEQDDQSAAIKLKEATEMLGDLRVNRIIAGPRQIQANAGRGAETMVGLGSPFGGVIVP